mmetsp:Transcript_12114/g.24622  ORF Transcript_12114/g.24622 Transcript_12114/m.24622 type:complete len:221 (-) Transcript_12114:42-704(-)
MTTVTNLLRKRWVTDIVVAVDPRGVRHMCVRMTESGVGSVQLAMRGSGEGGEFRAMQESCSGASGGSLASVISSGKACVYMLCGVSPKNPLAACSCKYMAWSMTVMQLLMLPISSRTVGWSVANRHSLSTINLYWYVPGGRFKQTTWSVPLRRSGMRSSHALNEPVTNTALPPADHCRTVGTGSASPDGSCSSVEGPAPLHPGAPEENSAAVGLNSSCVG